MGLPAARSSSLKCLSREERSDFEQITSRRSGEADRRTLSREVERGVRRSLLNTSYSSEEILAAASTGEKIKLGPWTPYYWLVGGFGQDVSPVRYQKVVEQQAS